MRRVGLSFLLLLLSFAAACGVSDPREGRAVVTVGKRSVTAGQLQKDMKRLYPDAEITPGEWAGIRRDLVEKMVDHYLVLEYGREKGITVSGEEVDSCVREIQRDYGSTDLKEILLRRCIDEAEWREALREQILVRKIVDSVVEAVPPPTREEIRAYFQDHADEYTLPPRVKVRQTVSQTKKEAQDLARRLAGGEKMGEIARTHSISPDREKGGEMGWIVRGEMEPGLEKVIFSLSVGQVSPVVESSQGFHLFQVVSKHPAGAHFLPEVAMEIQGRILSERGEALYSEWVKGLRGRFPVTLDEDLLSKMEWSK